MSFNNTQLTLQETGHIAWQSIANSPLPGDVVAKLVKGEAPLKPAIEIIDGALSDGQDKDQAKTIITNWLERHIDEKLENLVALNKQDIDGPAHDIAVKVFNAMGVIPRAKLSDEIAQLNEISRAQLRSKRIRLGPILAFVPPLNKPAAIRLRAMFWSLWHDKPLPAAVPNDGVVSAVIDSSTIDKDFYRAIGYPVYGPRAIRIDMLDRVVVDIYDSSKDWEFTAKHEYCEWLGATIDDMYAVLAAMGHERIIETTPEMDAPEMDAPETDAGTDTSTDTGTTPVGATEAATETNEEKTSDTAQTTKTEDKPALSKFKLRRGKMSGERRDYAKPNNQNKPTNKDSQKKHKKPHKKSVRKDTKPKTMSFEISNNKAEENLSPFAVLQQLKEK